ncbi:IS5/IS1182 family transposase [Streptomyces tremellae]|uniref:IS5/IS1182 family transposase n=1 Tax=Streptomyces tremellae TaxID=1124239 RepID=A0ABP7EXI2_9ACTN
MLVHLRKNETLPVLAAGFGVSTATAWRYVEETLDGTLIPIDRIAADEPYYSMKHRKHGMNVQVIARPDGTPLWFSRATPGRTHDLTAARAHGIVQACLTRQILVLADRAYQGAGATFRTPYYHHREHPDHYQQFNRDHARLRAPGERAFAQLKSRRILRRARCSTRRIGTIAQAVHTLLTCNYSG